MPPAESVALDVPLRRRRRLPGLLAPLVDRDCALLWTGRATSLLGDGVYVVAIAWLVYSLSNVPTAMSVVGLALSLPQVAFFLVGGVVSDRFERRRVLLVSDAMRGVAVGAIGLLAVIGALELWHVVALVALVGAGDGLFNPAFTAIIPDLVPSDQLVRANALEQMLRQGALRLIGPGLGGLAVAAAGAGAVLLFDAATFAFSTLCLAAMRRRPAPRAGRERTSALADLREGFAYLRGERWLWGVLLLAAVTLLTFWGPFEVLLPYVVKNAYGGGASDFGFILAAGGVGAVSASLAIGHLGTPPRPLATLLFAWGLMTSTLAGYGLATQTWQAAAVYLVAAALNALVMVTWSTMLQRLVPREMLGRVSSLDWVVSFALIPLSFVLTAPVAAALGARTTLIGAGVLGATSTLALWLLLLRGTDRLLPTPREES